MRGEGAGGTHGGDKRQRRHILVQPWSKHCGKIRGHDGARGKCSGVRG